MLDTESTDLLLDLGFDETELETIGDHIGNDDTDFEVGNYRFIHQDEIDEIQQQELSSNLYMLGCFNADFIADNTNLTYNIVKALQKAELYEAIGEAIMDGNYLEAMQSEYARLDGYGHHFAHYDHDTHEYGEYYVFRTN